VTIAKWFTPNDQNIDEVGITPDIEIEYDIEDVNSGVDPQMEAAIAFLKGEDVQSDSNEEDEEVSNEITEEDNAEERE